MNPHSNPVLAAILEAPPVSLAELKRRTTTTTATKPGVGETLLISPPPHRLPRQHPPDARPQRGAWAPGDYTNECLACGAIFTGDKRAAICAPCAYGDAGAIMVGRGPEEPPAVARPVYAQIVGCATRSEPERSFEEICAAHDAARTIAAAAASALPPRVKLCARLAIAILSRVASFRRARAESRVARNERSRRTRLLKRGTRAELLAHRVGNFPIASIVARPGVGSTARFILDAPFKGTNTPSKPKAKN